jgi:hypothetical protein
MVTKRIVEISELAGFPLWIAVVNANKVCEIVRATGFSVAPDLEHVQVYIPESMTARLEGMLQLEAPISFLLAALEDFESYQIKGKIKSVKTCEAGALEKQLSILKATTDMTNAFGLQGNKIFGYLTLGPFISIRMSCQEIFEQTPKPGTGTKIETSDEG